MEKRGLCWRPRRKRVATRRDPGAQAGIAQAGISPTGYHGTAALTFWESKSGTGCWPQPRAPVLRGTVRRLSGGWQPREAPWEEPRRVSSPARARRIRPGGPSSPNRANLQAASDPFPPGSEPRLPPSGGADGPSVAEVLPLCCFPRPTPRPAPFPPKILGWGARRVVRTGMPTWERKPPCRALP